MTITLRQGSAVMLGQITHAQLSNMLNPALSVPRLSPPLSVPRLSPPLSVPRLSPSSAHILGTWAVISAVVASHVPLLR